MPGLLTRSAQFGSAQAPARSTSPDGIWSKRRDSITFDQLQKFWSELPLQARKELLRLDKQTLFEQARRNLYCSRCNGLLLEGFSQIMTYGKSLQLDSSGFQHSDRMGNRHSQSQNRNDLDEVQDPSLHPWGGLSTTKHGALTVLDCFICSKSLKTLQNVFDSARGREHERELLYPDACGGGGRGWISQGMANYGRGHGTRETCALHTARLSCDTLVDFWSALGEETRSSLLRMKEEDFIERLMHRFDSKRFCRDCRRNVIREFKELKELKRVHKEPRCTRSFCVADSAFQYEVSEDTVQADWQQYFTDTVGTYHHFEWAIGTGEGQTDILDFEDVGMNGKVQVTGLDLSSLVSCYITLRAWKLDGRCSELCVKAHALKGQDCVHRRLVVGDGFVTILEGDSIRNFFEHAEEAEEEEDDDAMDKDGNELDSDGSRSQKHAKSPELAREFLLDAATVIFKEQVEKAFREGTARQNAHCIFVCLALKLLEERLHVACKEIITLEKQTKLLEEEEKEKREEEERKERRKTKEREKKLRRKERLKEKDRERERKLNDSKSIDDALPPNSDGSSFGVPDESFITPDFVDSINEPGDIERHVSPDIVDGQSSGMSFNNIKVDAVEQHYDVDGNFLVKSGAASEHLKTLRRKLRSRKDNLLDQASNWYDRRPCYANHESTNQQDEVDSVCSSRGITNLHRPSRERFVKYNHRNCYQKFNDRCSQARVQDRFDYHSCGCNHQDDHIEKDGYHISMARSGKEIKTANKTECTQYMPRSSYRNVRFSNGCYFSDNFVNSKGKHVSDSPGKEILRKQVWEPLDARKKCPRSSSDSKITSTVCGVEPSKDIVFEKREDGCQEPIKFQSMDYMCLTGHSASSGKDDTVISCKVHEDQDNSGKLDFGTNDCQKKLGGLRKTEYCSKNDTEEELSPSKNSCSDPVRSSSSSDNCFSCLSEGDSSTSSTSAQNAGSSVNSDSEDASQQSCGRNTSMHKNDSLFKLLDKIPDNMGNTNEDNSSTTTGTGFPVESSVKYDISGETSVSARGSNDGLGFAVAPSSNCLLAVPHHSTHVPCIPSPTMGYHSHNVDSWSASCNRFMPFPQPNHYVLPSHLGFGLTANRPSDFNMHYNAVQPVTAVFDASRQLLYQTSNRGDVGHSKDQKSHGTSCGFQQLPTCVEPIGSQRFLERSFPNRQLASQPSSAGQNDNSKNCADSHTEHPSFSLFHFGGPVAAGTSAGSSIKQQNLKDENTGELVSNTTTAQVQAQTCLEEEIKVQEYCLFSSRTGTRFSFF
ncbi:hypothetical protein Cni_G01900 [Canna indica]|uniref:Uncharacterized protein n=1 Tax=Canna indica TaxID=4628 RepID=A0AAQ3JR72_9LILI|nr:hypothetical protein Cni_G01900 [Canna indica]